MERGDFREHFDIRQLDEEQRGMIEYVLNSPAYNSYFKPFIEDILKTMNQQWKDRTKTRQDLYPDEFLAGGVVFGESLLKFFEIIIQETNIERINAVMENVTNEQLYDLKRQRGLVRPVVGLDQPTLPQKYDPDEDF